MERIATLLARYYQGTLTPAEIHELDQCCREQPAIRIILQQLDDKERVRKDLAHCRQIDPESRLSQFLEKVRRQEAQKN